MRMKDELRRPNQQVQRALRHLGQPDQPKLPIGEHAVETLAGAAQRARGDLVVRGLIAGIAVEKERFLKTRRADAAEPAAALEKGRRREAPGPIRGADAQAERGLAYHCSGATAVARVMSGAACHKVCTPAWMVCPQDTAMNAASAAQATMPACAPEWWFRRPIAQR